MRKSEKANYNCKDSLFSGTVTLGRCFYHAEPDICTYLEDVIILKKGRAYLKVFKSGDGSKLAKFIFC